MIKTLRKYQHESIKEAKILQDRSFWGLILAVRNNLKRNLNSDAESLKGKSS